MVGMEGKVVLITGASRGIGAAAGRVFSEAGALVGLMARDEAAATALATGVGGPIMVRQPGHLTAQVRAASVAAGGRIATEPAATDAVLVPRAP